MKTKQQMLDTLIIDWLEKQLKKGIDIHIKDVSFGVHNEIDVSWNGVFYCSGGEIGNSIRDVFDRKILKKHKYISMR